MPTNFIMQGKNNDAIVREYKVLVIYLLKYVLKFLFGVQSKKSILLI